MLSFSEASDVDHNPMFVTTHSTLNPGLAAQTNWATLDPKFAKVWIQCHVNVCRNKGKPCLLEEVSSCRVSYPKSKTLCHVNMCHNKGKPGSSAGRGEQF